MPVPLPLLLALLLALVPFRPLLPPASASAPGAADVPLTALGADPYVNATSRHATQTGPDTYQWGDTVVTAQQSGRFFDGGASGIAYAVSGDGGRTWESGALPGITVFGGGPYQRVSDPSVAYDAWHGVWLIASLAITDTGGITGAAVLASRSADGGRTWDAPVQVAVPPQEAGRDADLDKPWIACDDTPASPFHGRCHVAFADLAADGAISMARSSDGGLTWTATGTPASGTGAQPVVRPDGSVVVPYLGRDGAIRAFRSRDGGATWGGDTLVTAVQRHLVAGGVRALPLPSAEADAAGTVYVAWHDCRFQYLCGGNDVVLAASADGGRWGPVVRVTSDAGDHFVPGLGVDRASSGGTARLAVAYYRYPDAACAAPACRLTVAYTSSANGGRTWSPPLELRGPMDPAWLPGTGQGWTAGDYISTSVVPGGNAFPAFAAAVAPPAGVSDVRGHDVRAYDVRAYTVTGGLPITGGGPATLSLEVPVATGEPPLTGPLPVR
ncbi:glycoside hydrolase [Actinomadura sp. ATCC 31491]|uniref:Glycoside hydrolase n=1 Tax=Actinomadura luzonensis TaxID=2805427 RepID=A0ABT0G3S8_9ACTN|nr:sialidase family protein [Actinomadura luzonensis]MCK2219264.1 glycoside hydrolase [Actinomadura luzonensis]